MVQGTGRFCIALLPAVVATFAIATSVVSTVWCETIVFKPDESNPLVSDSSATDGFANLQFGLYYYAQIQDVDEETEEDFFSVTKSCTYYGSDVPMDAAWKTARAFALIAPILGGILALGLYTSPCCIFYSKGTWSKIAFMFLLVLPAFQSLTLLILTSDACKNNPVIENRLGRWIEMLGMDASSSSTTGSPTSNATSASGNSTSAPSAAADVSSTTMTEEETALLGVYPDDCEWDWGTSANLASVCLFFLTGVAMLVMGAPTRPEPKEPEHQTVTYQQTTNENGETVVQEAVTYQQTTNENGETVVQTANVATDADTTGAPIWADTSHTAKPY